MRRFRDLCLQCFRDAKVVYSADLNVTYSEHLLTLPNLLMNARCQSACLGYAIQVRLSDFVDGAIDKDFIDTESADSVILV